MGFGDPCHKHSLKNKTVPGEKEWYNKRDKVSIKCFHCELQIEGDDGCSCSRCDYWVHFSCIELPRFMAHPLHPEHILTLVCENTDTTNLCNGCQTPCIGGSYSYQCLACHFFLHPKCFYTHKHKKHRHILSFSKSKSKDDNFDCRICGCPVYDSNFGCTKCGFFIHHDCSLIPKKVKHHHVHELTIRHKFPKECDQVYCDICEDKDGKEINRKLSYYYCKQCDYIAHVRCVTQQRNDVFLVERYTHEHPLRLVRDPMIRDDNGFKLGCDQCNEVFDDQSLLFPLIKHPLHPDHTLTWLFGVDNGLFKCTDCEFTLPILDAKFTHPLVGDWLGFSCDRILFGCDACGELGKGCRMVDLDLDFHIECIALPGKLEHESHTEHPLYLLGLDASTYSSCNLCNEEIDPELWKYYCPECDYVAHLNCVASGLLSTLRLSIKNESRLCTFLEPDKTSFDFQIANVKPLNFLTVHSPRHSSSSGYTILLQDTKALENDVEHDKANWNTSTSTKDLGIKEAGNVLCCPKCDKLVSTPEKYSSIQEWESRHLSEFETLVNDLSQSKSEPLTLLSEQQIDDLYCPICSVLIFPPTYSCSSCQIYFHKSCANMPRKIKLFGETHVTHVLFEPPFPDNLPSCTRCNYPISGYAYVSSDGGSVYHVQCSLVAPLTKQVIDGHRIFCCRSTQKATMCRACGTCVDDGVPLFSCADCSFSIHTECALLPHIIRHKVHKHPLELVYDLAELDDEYICDACEKGLNPIISAYRCVDTCKGYATSHVTCVITSKKKSHFKYEIECLDMTEDQKIAFRTLRRLTLENIGSCSTVKS